MKYFGEIEERKGGFFFSYSEESLNAYLGSYFGFLSLNDAKGMAGLKAHEFFSSFMHQKGIITDKELRKIEREIEELNVPLRKLALRYFMWVDAVKWLPNNPKSEEKGG